MLLNLCHRFAVRSWGSVGSWRSAGSWRSVGSWHARQAIAGYKNRWHCAPSVPFCCTSSPSFAHFTWLASPVVMTTLASTVERLRKALILLVLVVSPLVIFIHRVARRKSGNVRDNLYSFSNSNLRIAITKILKKAESCDNFSVNYLPFCPIGIHHCNI